MTASLYKVHRTVTTEDDYEMNNSWKEAVHHQGEVTESTVTLKGFGIVTVETRECRAPHCILCTPMHPLHPIVPPVPQRTAWTPLHRLHPNALP